MNTNLISKHGATYFELLSPSENLSAIFDGSLGDILFEGILLITDNI